VNSERKLIGGIVLMVLLICLSLIYRFTYTASDEMVGDWENVNQNWVAEPCELEVTIEKCGKLRFAFVKQPGTPHEFYERGIRVWGNSVWIEHAFIGDGLGHALLYGSERPKPAVYRIAVEDGKLAVWDPKDMTDGIWFRRVK
jgi:hypothetical protein